MLFVPVVNKKQEPLMPTTPSRARKWMDSGKATGFWKGGVFCVRLNTEAGEEKQKIVVGVDPGSKKEGFTIKSEAHTYLNIQADAVQHVKLAVKIRRQLRTSRRFRKVRCRCNRKNRASLKNNRVPPSVRARWQWKLNILNWLRKLFPICCVVVEDIKTVSVGKRKWDVSFSPLQIGKNWFYSKIPNLVIKQGYETKIMRDGFNLTKISDKLSNSWFAHCVDSWVLANSQFNCKIVDNKDILFISPIILHRRKLHKSQPNKKGVRSRYGGTISLGFKKGCLVKHSTIGLAYVGGNFNGKIRLHSFKNGKVIKQTAKPKDCVFICYNTKKVTK